MYNGYNKEQLDIIKQGVPSPLIKWRQKGGRNYSYVELPVVTDILNRLFGNLWSWNILENNIHDTGIVDQKNGGTKRYVQIRGCLTVPMQDPHDPDKFVWIQREANGVHALNGADMEIRASAFKSASSDGLKKAASTLGVARNVYMSDELQQFLDDLEETGERDEWNDANIKEHQAEFDEMLAFSRSHPDKNYFYKMFCDETQNYTQYMKITPSNIGAFLEWYKAYKAKEEQVIQAEKTDPSTMSVPKSVPEPVLEPVMAETASLAW